MMQVSVAVAVLAFTIAGCRSAETGDVKTELSDDASLLPDMDIGAIPLPVHQDGEVHSSKDGKIYTLRVPIGEDRTGRGQRFVDRLLIKTDSDNQILALVVASYPGFFQGQVGTAEKMVIEVLTRTDDQFDIIAASDTKEAQAVLTKSFATDIVFGIDGFGIAGPSQTIKIAEIQESFNNQLKAAGFRLIQPLEAIVFDKTLSTPELMGMPYDEYSILEEIATQPTDPATTTKIETHLKIQRLTVNQLITKLFNPKRREHVAKTYKDEFPQSTPQITEFDSEMNQQIKAEMMELLKTINKE